MLRLTILLIISPFIVLAQNGNSPYSNLGLGDPIPEEYNNNTAMGGVSMAVPTIFHINANPAFLTLNNKYTTFELGGAGEYKRLSTRQNSVTDGNGSLRYLSFAFPIVKRYTINLGLRPVTNVSYNYSRVRNIYSDDDTVAVTYNDKGEGGINSVFMAHGIKITESLSIGLKTSYNFGAITKSYSSFAPAIGQQYILEKKIQNNYRGFIFAPSIGYRQHLNKEWYLNLGAMYELGSQGGFSSEHSIRKLDPRVQAAIAGSDSVLSVSEGNIYFPSTIRGGVSIEKNYKWLIGVEYKLQDWQKFKTIDNSESLKSVTSFALGGQYIQNINAVKGYLNRVIFRFGVYYNQNNYAINNNTIDDKGATFGVSLPVGRLSFVNFAFSAGQRGNKSTDLLQEDYYRFNIGVTFNDRWFVRSKYD